jgi:2',3'-cyclic-nucleotide 2'-phosphodiesterase (5'-nucleotidase family)
MKLAKLQFWTLCLGLSALTAYAQSPAPAPQPTPAPLKIEAKASQLPIDADLAEDEATKAVLAPYVAKVRELAQPIGKLADNLNKRGMGGGSLGNLVTDAMRNRAAVKLGRPVILAITNSGGLRKNDIKAGDLSAMDIYELLPFDNALVTVDLTGAQLRRFLDVIVARRDAQAGARILYYTADRKSVISGVRLRDQAGQEKEIDPSVTYTIVTIDYLVKRGGDYAVLQEGKNLKPLNVTLRDAVLEYVKAETAAHREIKATLDGRFRLDRTKTGATETDPDY